MLSPKVGVADGCGERLVCFFWMGRGVFTKNESTWMSVKTCKVVFFVGHCCCQSSAFDDMQRWWS